MSDDLSALKLEAHSIFGSSTVHWTPVNWNTVTHAQAEAITRLVLAGLFEGKIFLVFSCPPSPIRIAVHYRVTGNFGADLIRQSDLYALRYQWSGAQIIVDQSAPRRFTHLRLTHMGVTAAVKWASGQTDKIDAICAETRFFVNGEAIIESEEILRDLEIPVPHKTKSLVTTPVDPIAVAVTMKVQNPNLSVRNAALAVGISPSKLQRSPVWQTAVERLKQVGKGSPRLKDEE
jgi:hypothetical protein